MTSPGPTKRKSQDPVTTLFPPPAPVSLDRPLLPKPDPVAAVEPGGAAFESAVTPRAKRRKEKKEAKKSRVQFQYNTNNFYAGRKIGIAHVRDLVLNILGDAKGPDWMNIENKSQIEHVVLLLAPGLTTESLGLPPIGPQDTLPFSTDPSLSALTASTATDPAQPRPKSSVPQIQKMFLYGCPTRAPGDSRRMHSAIDKLLRTPLSEQEVKLREAQVKERAAASQSQDGSPLQYLITVDQMIEFNYPLPSYLQNSPSSSGSVTPLNTNAAANKRLLNQGLTAESLASKWKGKWKETPRAEGEAPNGTHPVLAVDCEMVLTEGGEELARVSIIDFYSGVKIFDQHVKPVFPIIDYRTQWSGITPEKVESATHTLESIHRALLSGSNPLITPHTILVGHSLDCDLKALKIRHEKCIDTSLIFKHPKAPLQKFKLKDLARRWLSRDIQGNVGGHDPEEDARAALDLLKLKMKNGPEFGNVTDHSESIFERLARYVDPVTQKARTTAFCDSSFNPRAGHGAKATTAPKCNGDEEVMEAIITNAASHDLTIGRLMDLTTALKWNGDDTRPPQEGTTDNVSKATSYPSPRPSVEDAFLAFNQSLKQLYDSLPSNTAFILLTLHSDPRPLKDLTRRYQLWERKVRELGGVEHLENGERWMTEDDRQLEAAALRAREGMAFFCVKPPTAKSEA